MLRHTGCARLVRSGILVQAKKMRVQAVHLDIRDAGGRMQAKTEGKLAGSASVPAIVGASFLWTWLDQCMFGPTLGGFANPAYTRAFMVLVVLASVVGLAVSCFVLRRELSATVWHRLPAAVSAILGTVGCAICGLAELSCLLSAFIVGCVVVGFSMGLLMVLWGVVAIAQGMERTILHVSGAWGLGFVLNCIITYLPLGAQWWVVALLPLASLALYAWMASLQGRAAYEVALSDSNVIAPQSGRCFMGLDLSFVLTIFTLCLVFGLVESFDSSYSFHVGEPRYAIDVVLARCLTSVLVFAVCVRCSLERVGQVLQIGLSLLIIGSVCLVGSLMFDELRFFGRVFVGVGYAGFDMLVWALMSYYARISIDNALKIVAGALAIDQLGIMTGSLLYSGALAWGQPSGMFALCATLIAATYFLIVACFFLIRRYLDLWPMFDAAPVQAAEASDAPSGNSIERIAERSGLTNREVDVLRLLAAGRNVPYIAESLCISENTVKSHVRHIYEKCGYHDRQELLDDVAVTPS